jgi:P-type conjugative transfer protein TrbJ
MAKVAGNLVGTALGIPGLGDAIGGTIDGTISDNSSDEIECSNCATSADIKKIKDEDLDPIREELNWANQRTFENKAHLSTNPWESVNPALNEMLNTYVSSRALHGTAADFDQKFRDQIGTYEDYLLPESGTREEFARRAARWQEQGSEGVRAAMASAGKNVNQIAAEDTRLADLMEQSHNAQGQLGVMEAGNGIQALAIQELQKTRIMMNDLIQMQGVMYMQQVEQQAIGHGLHQQRHVDLILTPTPGF